MDQQQAITNRPIDITEVPFIPADLQKSEIDLLIPKGFDSEIEWELQNTTLVLKILRADIEGTEIKIEQSIWNPHESNVRFPKYLFEVSSLRTNKRPNYHTTHANYVLNQNQLLYMVLQHRLYSFSINNKAFGYLMKSDIAAITNFMEYVVPKAYNAIKKIENTWTIISPWDEELSTYAKPVLKQTVVSQNVRLIGDILRNTAYKPSDTAMPMICADLPIHPSSESSLSTSGKLVVAPYNLSGDPLYRSVGWKEVDGGFLSIFPPKQNIVARLKTHLIADAYALAKPSSSVFFQDNIPNRETQQYELKDPCLRKAYVVFAHMDKQTNRFLAGEIEASPSFVDTEILQHTNKTELFNEVNIKVGESIKVQNNQFVVGTLTDDSEVIVRDLSNVKCLSIQSVGLLGCQKVRLQLTRKAGNARIDSNTGIKGVTKCKPNLGVIQFNDFSYQSIKPDLVLGMNAVKAKENTIVLAQAALAVDLGCYVPNNKWKLLNTLDEAEINKAAQSLPKFTYINEFGKEETVFIGMAYVRFTELAKTYGRPKDMSFMFETGRFLAQNGNKELADHIWEHYVPKESKDLVTELTKIFYDKGCNSFPEDNLPTYSYKTVTAGTLFKEADFVFSKVQNMPSQSKLLDPEWNKNGFYLSMQGAGRNAPIIRVPSADLLNLMVSELPDKTWCYPAILTKISNILSYCLRDKEGNTKYHYIFSAEGSERYTEHTAYMNEVYKLLYSGESLLD